MNAVEGEDDLQVNDKESNAIKVARGYFLGTEVLFSKSSFRHVNLNQFF